MRFLTLTEVLAIYDQIMLQSGGAVGLHDLGALESALAQPRMTFGGQDLYPTLVDKAAALGFCLIKNHPFLDGNKRTGHAALEVFLVLNGHEIQADLAEQEQVILRLAAGKMERDEFTRWLQEHIRPIA
jgi:death-on-curing protein